VCNIILRTDASSLKNLTADFLDHSAFPGDLPGFEGVQSRFTYWQSAFEDAEEENLAMIGQGDMMAVLYNLHAKHAGAYMGIEPTQSSDHPRHRIFTLPGWQDCRALGHLRFHDYGRGNRRRTYLECA